MGLAVTGTLGVLIAGHKAGIIDDLDSEIDSLRGIGFRISTSLVKQLRIMLDK